MIDVTYLDTGLTTLMCYLGHYGLDGQTTVWVITGWIIRLRGWWLMVHTLMVQPYRLGGFHICGGAVGIKIWLTAMGYMEPFRAQLGKTLSALLRFWC